MICNTEHTKKAHVNFVYLFSFINKMYIDSLFIKRYFNKILL